MVQSMLTMAKFRPFPLFVAHRCRALLMAGLILGLGACAQAGHAPEGVDASLGSVRVICRLTEPRDADNRLALDLARAAGMPVLHIQAIGDRLVAVEYRCAPESRCEQGLARLRSVSPLVSDITLDGQAQVPRQPTRPQERP
jgi:hypothetical protein